MRVLAGLLALLLAPYLAVPVHDFAPATRFTGARWLSPYDGIASATWRPGVFHAHGHAWGGLTAGDHDDDDVRAGYAALGVTLLAITNYHTISAPPPGAFAMRGYEHGWNVAKTHQTVLGARAVYHGDFPLWQGRDEKQYVLDRLHADGDLVVLNHPWMRRGYSPAEVAALGGWELLEVRSHFGDGRRHWDAALSAGRLAYGIAGDDSHRVADDGQFGATWTLLPVAGADAAAVTAALRQGRGVLVTGRRATVDVVPRAVVARGDTVTVTWSGPTRETRFVTDGGRTVAVVRDAAVARAVLPASAGYVRIEATTPATELLLNPLVRWDGAARPGIAAATIDPGATTTRAALLGTLVAWLLAHAVGLRALPDAAVRRAVARRLRTIVRPRPVAPLLAALSLLVPARRLGAQAPVPPPAQPFAIGEHAEYDVKFGALSVGRGQLSVEGPDTARGRRVVRLVFALRGGIPFFRVDDRMTSWFDPVARQSVRFVQELHEGSRRYSRHYDFDATQRTVHQRGKEPEPSVAEPLDDASFVFFVRGQPLEPGTTLTFDRYFRPSGNPVVIKVLRRERVTVPAGTFDAIVVQPIIRTSGVFGDKGRAELWLADDSTRAVLQLKSRLNFGSINLYLRSYRRGTGELAAASAP